MADRNTIAPLGDSFLVWTGVISSLITQLIFTLIGLGAGVLTVRYTLPAGETFSWAAFIYWAATGVFAAAVGGAVIGTLAPGANDVRLTMLALLAWAIAVLIVAFVTALTAGGGASVVSSFGGPFAGMLDQMAQGKITPPMQRVLTGIAIGSVVALLLGAAASVAAAIYSPETRSVRVSRRA